MLAISGLKLLTMKVYMIMLIEVLHMVNTLKDITVLFNIHLDMVYLIPHLIGK